MAKRYQQNQWNKIKEHFREHPYYKLCKTVFDEFQKLCPTMVMTPEQLFVDASLTLDSILQTGDKSAEQCHSLWTEKYNQYREQDQMTGRPEDTKAEVAMLFYIVMYGVATVNHSHYRGTLQRTLHDCIFNLYYERDIKRCLGVEQNLHEPINQHTAEMQIWMEEYFTSKESLTKEIEEAISSRKSKDEDNFQPIGTTFTKTALLTDKLIDIIGQRLTQANKLNASPDDWRKLFSGIDQQFDITWLGTEGELRDLFKMLTDKPQYAKPKRNFQLILKSHFLDEHGRRFNNLHGAKSIDSFQPILDDCAFLLQHLTDSMTAIMKRLVKENEDALREMGYFDKVQEAKHSGLSIRNKRR